MCGVAPCRRAAGFKFTVGVGGMGWGGGGVAGNDVSKCVWILGTQALGSAFDSGWALHQALASALGVDIRLADLRVR